MPLNKQNCQNSLGKYFFSSSMLQALQNFKLLRSFLAKNESINPFSFRCKFACFRKEEIHSLWPYPWKRSLWRNPHQERTNENARIYLQNTLPYKKYFSMASVDNTLLDLQNSLYPTQPYSIIAVDIHTGKIFTWDL